MPTLQSVGNVGEFILNIDTDLAGIAGNKQAILPVRDFEPFLHLVRKTSENNSNTSRPTVPTLKELISK